MHDFGEGVIAYFVVANAEDQKIALVAAFVESRMNDGDVLSVLTCIIEHMSRANAGHKIIDYGSMPALEHLCSSIGEQVDPLTRRDNKANKDLN